MLQDNDSPVGSGALLERIAAGERTALAQLFQSEASLMLGVAMRIVRRRDLAEDVVQETFVTIWRKAGQFDPARGNSRGWMITIVRNKALNLIRDAARMEPHDHDGLEKLGERLGAAETAYERLPDNHDLKTCLSRLDPDKRRSVLLSYVTGLTSGEVAATLNVPLGTAKSWIRRGLAALQECLQ